MSEFKSFELVDLKGFLRERFDERLEQEGVSNPYDLYGRRLRDDPDNYPVEIVGKTLVEGEEVVFKYTGWAKKYHNNSFILNYQRFKANQTMIENVVSAVLDSQWEYSDAELNVERINKLADALVNGEEIRVGTGGEKLGRCYSRHRGIAFNGCEIPTGNHGNKRIESEGTVNVIDRMTPYVEYSYEIDSGD